MNKAKIGLDYFPFEIGFFEDIKIRKLIKFHGAKAIPVYLYLQSEIYKNGYYLRWDDMLPYTISEKIKYEEDYIMAVINCLFEVELLSKKMYDDVKILTSKGIQERYSTICKHLKRKSTVSLYSLISSEYLNKNTEDSKGGKTAKNDIIIQFPEDLPNNPEESIKNTEDLIDNTENKTQRKGKESIINEKKGNYLRLRQQIISGNVSTFFRDNFVSYLEQWQMKNTETKFEDVLKKMDEEYICHDFHDENHLKNSFKSCFEKLSNEKKYNKNGKFTEVPQQNRNYDEPA